MEIREIEVSARREYLELLLLGDEQLDMVERYIGEGKMFVLYDGSPISEALVIEKEDRAVEIKNIATYPAFQRMGYATALMSFLFDYFRKTADAIYVGTGDNRETLDFYRHLGFGYSHTVKGFFTDNYDHPIFEDGHRLTDMIYLKKELKRFSPE